MIASIRDLSRVLEGSLLGGRDITEVPVLDTGETVYAIRIPSEEVESAWRAARRLLPQTQRWPVATILWDAGEGSEPTEPLMRNLFSRFFYEEAPNPGDVSPRALRDRARTVNVSEFIAGMAADRDEVTELEAVIAAELAETEARCGSAPTRAALDAAGISNGRDLQRWLLRWEDLQGCSIDPTHARQEWFRYDPTVLLFLPTASGWETLAYLHWYGTSDQGAENYIALGRSWERDYGAELVAHYGTMLQCLVNRPPTTVDEAWDLACAHDLAGSCTLLLPGIKLRDYARGLIDSDRWFLHERP